jgi:hypothetical protein
MLKLEFKNGDVTLCVYNSNTGAYMSGRHIMHAVQCEIGYDTIKLIGNDNSILKCMKRDIKIIGDLHDIPHGALGEGWCE